MYKSVPKQNVFEFANTLKICGRQSLTLPIRITMVAAQRTLQLIQRQTYREIVALLNQFEARGEHF
jgi:hypothetical protein